MRRPLGASAHSRREPLAAFVSVFVSAGKTLGRRLPRGVEHPRRFFAEQLCEVFGVRPRLFGRVAFGLLETTRQIGLAGA